MSWERLGYPIEFGERRRFDARLEAYCHDPEVDQERIWMALAEVGLEPDESGGGWIGWTTELTPEERRQVEKAERLSR